MKKASKYIILIIPILLLILFLFAYKNYQFGTDAIWKIEQQRREHTYIFPFVAKFIHNKGFYFSYKVFEKFLSFTQPLLLEIIILMIFYEGFFVLLSKSSKLSHVVLSWILVYPLFPSLMLREPSFLLMLPIIFPVFLILMHSIFLCLNTHVKREPEN
jgi:hypothetical protein